MTKRKKRQKRQPPRAFYKLLDQLSAVLEDYDGEQPFVAPMIQAADAQAVLDYFRPRKKGRRKGSKLRVTEPNKDMEKALRIRATHPDISYPDLAEEVGIRPPDNVRAFEGRFKRYKDAVERGQREQRALDAIRMLHKKSTL